jgi:hypothetical protein
VRGVRKAAGLISKQKMAELPKDESLVCSAFFMISIFVGVQHDSHLLLLSANLHSH